MSSGASYVLGVVLVVLIAVACGPSTGSSSTQGASAEDALEPSVDAGEEPTDVRPRDLREDTETRDAPDPLDDDADDARVDPTELGTDTEGRDCGADAHDVPEEIVPEPDGPPVSDWVPDGEWVQGPCAPGTLPAGYSPVDAYWDDLGRMAVGRDGLCACYPGVCVEIPPLAVDVPSLFGLSFLVRVPSPHVAGSMVAYLNLRDDALLPDWSAVDRSIPWRIALRTFDPALTGGTHPDTEVFMRFARWSSPEGQIPHPMGGGWVTDDVWAFEWYPHGDGGAAVYLAHEPDHYCGDGVIDSDEQCDAWGPDATGLNRGCHSGCVAGPEYTCFGEPSICLRHCQMLVCDEPDECGNPGACEIVDKTCDDPGPCARAACDARFGGCVTTPIAAMEGEPCETDDGEAGWCEAGACVSTPRECVRCADGGRWVDGACHPTEQGATWVAVDGLDQPRSTWGYEDGVYHLTPVGGWIDMADPDVRYFNSLGGTSTEITIDSGWLEIQYRVVPWDEPVFIELLTKVGWLELEQPEDWTVARFAIADVDGPTGLFEVAVYPVRLAVRGGRIDFRRIRYSEQGLGVCEEAVDVDGEWFTCMTRVGMAWCGDACADLLSNEAHCGECGNVCDDDEVCVGGECRCDPAVAQYAPERCEEDCPPGTFGLDCTGVCPGVEETGVACSGNGICWDGVFGVGRCDCLSGYHGNHCQLSCSDGVRNGREQSIDCGGFVCPGCPGF